MNVRIFKCFIASPSDTQAEREACDDVFTEINETIGQRLKFRIESKKWEKDARPSFGADGQTVITEQLLDNYQLFIGIMWNKFGTPTKRAESGTEEEFNHAYNRHSKGSDVEIMLYFNEEPVTASTLDPGQLTKVNEFKAKAAKLGSLYCLYSGVDNFKKKLSRHLNDYFVTLLDSTTENPKFNATPKEQEGVAVKNSVSLILQSRLSEALCLFSNQPTIWVDPLVSETDQISMNPNENYENKVDLEKFVTQPESVLIKAPPQFGLTCLALNLCKIAWTNSRFWVYLDAKKIRRSDVEKSVKKEINTLNLSGREIDCLVLDSWNGDVPGSRKMLRNLCNTYRDIPIVVMQTIDDTQFSKQEEEIKINREFRSLHLLAFSRNQVRSIVTEYNDEKHIGDEVTILNKVISDLEVLNVHRTPQNCLTLLKVAEKHFDESPVNRTKMIEMVLFALFDLNEIPNYRSKPDVKDCEFVLGRFCEKLLRENTYVFSRNGFLEDLELYCEEKLLHLEVEIVFDVLYENNILVQKGSDFSFRSTYWIYYFSATRMYVDNEFCDFVITERPYPEIIEFYTGIDRNRGELLETLVKGLAETCDLVDEKTGLPDELNPLKGATWNPSFETIKSMRDEVNENVQTSKLPDTLKDSYADRKYDQRRPYDQSVQNILSEYSMVTLKNQIISCSRALRNSDYVDTDLKRRLLREITRGWRIWSKILFALGPMLATQGSASFDGQGFQLRGNFGDTKEEILNSVFLANPFNIITQFKDDLYSQKMGPLLFDAADIENDELRQHLLFSLIATTRPPNWKKTVEKYIDSLPNNSYYLADIVTTLRTAYQYDFCSNGQIGEISLLIKKGLAKHEFDEVIPSMKNIKRVSNKNLREKEIR